MNTKQAIKNLNAMKMNYDQRDKKSIPIQTIDMAIEALEKQIPKPPEYKVHEKYPTLGKDYYCQECGVLFASWEDENGRTNYCGNCGQRLR